MLLQCNLAHIILPLRNLLIIKTVQTHHAKTAKMVNWGNKAFSTKPF